MRKLVIGGFSGSGKSTLCTLLDGHSRLRVSFFIEKFMRVFTVGRRELQISSNINQSGREIIGYPHFILNLEGKKYTMRMSTFKTLLYLYTYYFHLENEAFQKKTATECTNQQALSLDLDMNFNQFEKMWKEELFRLPIERTAEEVIDILYKSLFNSFDGFPQKMDEEYIAVFCNGEERDVIELMLNDKFDIKFIFMNRPLEDLWAVEIDRQILDGITRSDAEFALCKTWRAERQAKLLRFYHVLAKERPHQVMMLSIDDVVINYKKTIPKICEFLGIEFEDILLHPTFRGREEDSLINYIGTVHDAGRHNTISSKSKKILKLQQSSTGVLGGFSKIDWETAIAFVRLNSKYKLLPSLKAKTKKYLKKFF